jgi:hypothetical protein
VIHLRPLRSGARKVRDHSGSKEPWRSEPLYAPRDVVAVFQRASLKSKPGRDGIRLVKLRTKSEGGLRHTRPEDAK